jgi:CRISPR system Cascade subunit CasC
VNPTGKQNSFAAHNPPDGILVAVKPGGTPISYANAFASPVPLKGPRDLVSQSIAQLGQYIHDLDTGYASTGNRLWFSPNLRYPLNYIEENKEQPVTAGGENVRSFDDLVRGTVKAIGFDWDQAQAITVK